MREVKYKDRSLSYSEQGDTTLEIDGKAIGGVERLPDGTYQAHPISMFASFASLEDLGKWLIDTEGHLWILDEGMRGEHPHGAPMHHEHSMPDEHH
jgi:hypothetical protein